MAENPISIVIHSDLATKLNFASHQSSFPLIRSLRIENLDKENPIENLKILVTTEPAFVKSKSWCVDKIAGGESAIVKYRDVELEGGFLLDLIDSIRGSIVIRVEKDGALLAEQSQKIELLAYNEWGGSGYMPELLAAFSMPNDPAVDQILHSASEVLRKANRKDTIEGYQSGERSRIWEIAGAIYNAIANLGIRYAVPPSSFEKDGQKIRVPSAILEGGVATCLDTAMLFASALEQAGLNPIIAMPKDHAVVGVWLQPEVFSTILIDDAEILRKRCQLKELILIETTFVTTFPAPSFSKAIEAAHQTIGVESEKTFSVAVDIRRARAHKITPLGLKIKSQNPSNRENEIASYVLPFEEAPVLPDFDDEVEEGKPLDSPAKRLEHWQRKLLDLTARNTLLNYKASKTSFKFLCPDPAKLEDKLASGAKFTINSLPKMSGQNQDEEVHLQRTGEVIYEEYAKAAIENHQLIVDLPENELSKRAIEIYRKAQTSLQEGGANTLYLALGFLSWKRETEDERRFLAPLILMPITLERSSVRSGVKVVAHDDEPRFNTTLLEMLRKDFRIDIKGLEGELPEDESGIDVNAVWNKVRKAVKDVSGFEVIHDVVMGHFSFSKYLMWKDLIERTDVLRLSPIVRHLIDTPRDAYASNITFVDKNEIDKNFDTTELLSPLPADSSQMAAIATADRGKDFIMIGPPGTGKSQTISNLIAHMLGNGKTVLFVSEKTAALEVVYRRMKDIGLGKYCLELHSNKARKVEIINKLNMTWTSALTQPSEMWEKEAERLRRLRDQLNRVVEHLHRVHGNGLTPHYAIGVKVRDEGKAAGVVFSWPKADQHDKEQLSTLREAVEHLQVQAKAIKYISSSPFQLIVQNDWSPQWESRVVECAGQLSIAAKAVDLACTNFCKAIQVSLPDQKMSRLDSLSELAKALIESHRKQTSYVLANDGQARLEALEEAVVHLKAYAHAQAELSCEYEPFAWKALDGDTIINQWRATKEAWWPKSYIGRRNLIKAMRQGGAIGKPNPAHDGKVLKKLRIEGEAIERLDVLLSELKAWKQHNTDPVWAEDFQKLGRRVRESVGGLTDDVQTLVEFRSKIRTLLHDGNDLLAADSTVGQAASKYLVALNALQVACADFESIAGQSVREFFANSERALEGIRSTSETISKRHAELHDWCSWRKRRAEAMDLNLGPLVEAIEQGRVLFDDIPQTFETAYCTWWSTAIIEEDEVIRTFSSSEHVAAIDKFRDIDNQFQKSTAAYIDAKLSGQLPTQDDIKKSSQWGILRHESQKKIRHKPVRQLMQEIPQVITSLAPCLMMSPLSVAQYLPAGQALFDVVIFDEASQITVWDAVGSIARGKQVIVAGDPKQMPPANFFNRSDDDPDGCVDFEGDLESILDELRSSNVPECFLNLHYRSSRESLIAFSNARYYDNSLITFPAPIHPDCGVKLVRSEGYYDRGKARHNEGEARMIVQEVVRRLTSENQEERNLTIGIVTFNAEQQSLISDLLDKARAQNVEIENAFSNDLLEPVIVRNLETVQGDERDVILFSITYGPDESGHVTMHFGPLNKVGGERRLNVAITRARHEMIVFSSLQPHQFDLSRTNAQAVRDLKHFLEYAEHGRSALGSAVHGSLGDFESPFETAVARELRDRGWIVHPQIGVSAFRIDLGIVHPDEPGVYLAGVECDGAMYHSSANARERDKIRQNVLENLGWTLFRVWSTDWWINKAKAFQKLNEQLDELLQKKREEKIRDSEEKHTSGDIVKIEPPSGEHD